MKMSLYREFNSIKMCIDHLFLSMSLTIASDLSSKRGAELIYPGTDSVRM